MSRRGLPEQPKGRTCAHCGIHISERRPVYLIISKDQKILGPLHAHCAWIISQNERKAHHKIPRGWEGTPPDEAKARDETLPW